MYFFCFLIHNFLGVRSGSSHVLPKTWSSILGSIGGISNSGNVIGIILFECQTGLGKQKVPRVWGFWNIFTFLIISRYRNQRIGQGWRPGPAQDDEGRRWPGLLHRGRSHRQTFVFNKGKTRSLSRLLLCLILDFIGERLTSVFPLRLPVANPSRDSGGLGPDGEIYGADHLQVSAGRTWRPLLSFGKTRAVYIIRVIDCSFILFFHLIVLFKPDDVV